MKKLTTALLTALLLLNLAACGEKEPDDTPSGYDDSLISELYSERVSTRTPRTTRSHTATMCQESCRKRRSPPR